MLKIEYIEEEIPVYDITVETNSNFFANDILVHNCTEILLPTRPITDLHDTENGQIATCILGATNVGKIKKLEELEVISDLQVRFLDELIDYQSYPVAAAEKYTKNYRTLGVGFTGLAHYLARQGVKYEDENAPNVVHELTEAFAYYLTKASMELAKEKGAAPNFKKSKYADGILPIDYYKKDIDAFVTNELKYDWETLRQDIKTHGLRNMTLMAQMPVESSSLVTNSTNGIEPPREYLSIKVSKKGTIKQIVPGYSTIKNNYTLLWDQESNTGYLKIVATIQKFFDQTISVNTRYDSRKYEGKSVPMSVMIGDLLTAYKWGVVNLYYHNSNDDKNDTASELPSLAVAEELVDDLEDDCEACKI